MWEEMKLKKKYNSKVLVLKMIKIVFLVLIFLKDNQEFKIGNLNFKQFLFQVIQKVILLFILKKKKLFLLVILFFL
jgi:hypothetical protein